MVALESIVPNHIYVDRNYGRIVVRQGTLPSKEKEASIVGVAQSRLSKYGPLEVMPEEAGIVFKLEAGNGEWGIQRAVQGSEESTVISFAPFDYRGRVHKKDKDGKFIFEKPRRLVTVSYEGLDGSDDLLHQIKSEYRSGIKSSVEQMLQRARTAQAKISLENVTQRNVETQASQSVRTRGGVRYETESVDSILCEFGDTAIDFTETEGFRREDRYSTSSRESFDPAQEAELLSFVTALIFDTGGQVRRENILGFGPSFIRVRGMDGIVYRIDREKGGDVTHLVIESDNGVVPIEFREPHGFRDLFGTRILNEVFPVLRRQSAEEKRDTTLRRIIENLELMDPPMLGTCVSYDELFEIIKRSPQSVQVTKDKSSDTGTDDRIVDFVSDAELHNR